MRRSGVVVLLALTACASGGRTAGSLDRDIFYGSWQFTGAVYGQNTTAVNGILDIGPAFYDLTSTVGNCRNRMPPTRQRDLGLGCRGLSITLRRLENGEVDEWAVVRVTVEESIRKDVCVEWREDTQGRRTCIRTQAQPEFQSVSRTGRVRLERTD